MSKPINTVAIIGSGPSGGTLASLLRMRGVEVTIFDDDRDGVDGFAHELRMNRNSLTKDDADGTEKNSNSPISSFANECAGKCNLGTSSYCTATPKV